MVSFRELRRNTVPQAGARHLARGAAAGTLLLTLLSAAAPEPLVPDALLRAILGELSVSNSMQQTAAVAAHARYPNSQGFFDAARFVADRAREYGLQNVRIERFPASRPMWDQEQAEMEVVSPGPPQAVKTVLAQHSADGEITAELADSSRADIRGKIAMTAEEPDQAWPALKARGAIAVISSAAGVYFGRRTPPQAILWSMAPPDAVALMISPKDAGALRELLNHGPVQVRLRARARRTTPGAIGMVTGEIPGTQKSQDIVLAAHLDHQMPGANDNASGDGTLLELVRTVNHLIAANKIPKLRRTLRFWWTTEIESEQAYFRAHPEEAKNILLSIVLDQAGGQRNAENNLIFVENPEWLPSYADDLIENLAESVKDRYAPAEHQPDPLMVAEGGSAQSLRTVYWDYQPITDEVAFEARGIGVPGISMAVPSLDLIHSDLDTPDRLDPTWMKRTALLTLAPALYIANAGLAEARAIAEYTFRRSISRLALSDNPGRELPRERRRLDSVRAIDSRVDLTGYQARLGAVVEAMSGR